MLNHLLFFAARNSWRCYQSLSFVVVNAGGLRIPIANGMGLGMLNAHHGVAPLVRAVYAYRSGTFVDIGANIGAVLVELTGIDRNIPYVGFEPQLQAACYVQRLIRENGLQDTHAIYPIALADYCGTSVLMSNDESDVSATLTSAIRPTSMYRNRVPISVSTGDMQLHGLERIAAIKIDAEGAEPLVLTGLRETIKKHRPAIIIEIAPYYHIEDNSYDKSYFGDLPEEERMRLVEGRKMDDDIAKAIEASVGDFQAQFASKKSEATAKA